MGTVKLCEGPLTALVASDYSVLSPSNPQVHREGSVAAVVVPAVSGPEDHCSTVQYSTVQYSTVVVPAVSGPDSV